MDFVDPLQERIAGAVSKTGIEKRLKSELRFRLIESLHKDGKAARTGEQRSQVAGSASLRDRAFFSIILEFLKAREKYYALSVLLPECGLQSDEVLSREEIGQVLSVTRVPAFSACSIDEGSGPLLEQLFFELSSLAKPTVTTQGIQTDDDGVGQGLEAKLQACKPKYDPFGDRIAMEERMLQFQARCEARCRQEAEAEIARIRTIERERMALEASTKCRMEMHDASQQAAKEAKERDQKLREKERAALDRLRAKEIELEKKAVEWRAEAARQVEEGIQRQQHRARKLEAEEQRNQAYSLALEQRELVLKQKEERLREREQAQKSAAAAQEEHLQLLQASSEARVLNEAQEVARLKEKLDNIDKQARRREEQELEQKQKAKDAAALHELRTQRFEMEEQRVEAQLASLDQRERLLREKETQVRDKEDAYRSAMDTHEERMRQFQAKCEAKVRQETEAEVARLRTVELQRAEQQEVQRCRFELQEFRDARDRERRQHEQERANLERMQAKQREAEEQRNQLATLHLRFPELHAPPSSRHTAMPGAVAAPGGAFASAASVRTTLDAEEQRLQAQAAALEKQQQALREQTLQNLERVEAQRVAAQEEERIRQQLQAQHDACVCKEAEDAQRTLLEAEEAAHQAKVAALQKRALALKEEELQQQEEVQRVEERRRAEEELRAQEAEDRRLRAEQELREQEAEDRRLRAEEALRAQEAAEKTRQAEEQLRAQEAEERRLQAEEELRAREAEERRRQAEQKLREQEAEERRRQAEEELHAQEAADKQRQAEEQLRAQEVEDSLPSEQLESIHSQSHSEEDPVDARAVPQQPTAADCEATRPPEEGVAAVAEDTLAAQQRSDDELPAEEAWPATQSPPEPAHMSDMTPGDRLQADMETRLAARRDEMTTAAPRPAGSNGGLEWLGDVDDDEDDLRSVSGHGRNREDSLPSEQLESIHSQSHSQEDPPVEVGAMPQQPTADGEGSHPPRGEGVTAVAEETVPVTPAFPEPAQMNPGDRLQAQMETRLAARREEMTTAAPETASSDGGLEWLGDVDDDEDEDDLRSASGHERFQEDSLPSEQLESIHSESQAEEDFAEARQVAEHPIADAGTQPAPQEGVTAVAEERSDGLPLEGALSETPAPLDPAQMTLGDRLQAEMEARLAARREEMSAAAPAAADSDGGLAWLGDVEDDDDEEEEDDLGSMSGHESTHDDTNASDMW